MLIQAALDVIDFMASISNKKATIPDHLIPTVKVWTKDCMCSAWARQLIDVIEVCHVTYEMAAELWHVPLHQAMMRCNRLIGRAVLKAVSVGKFTHGEEWPFLKC